MYATNKSFLSTVSNISYNKKRSWACESSHGITSVDIPSSATNTTKDFPGNAPAFVSLRTFSL